MTEGEGRRFATRATELVAGGPAGAGPLPKPDELARRPEERRHAALDGLRVELYAIASLVADATVGRALRERPSYPPYGLVRSRYSETRMVAASPGPFEQGSIDSFHTLGRAFLDTMVFHLDHQLREQALSADGWLLKRLDHLLVLFSVPAGPATRARLRDRFSFLYGGLHFGVSVCAQLAEVMARLLEGHPGTTAEEKAEVIRRSIRPANRLATLNVDHVVLAYQNLQAAGPAPGQPRGPGTWMDRNKFAVQQSEGAPWRIDFRDDQAIGWRGRRLEDVPATYTTHGCPARASPAGGPSAIANLWSWTAELALVTGLLGARPVR